MAYQTTYSNSLVTVEEETEPSSGTGTPEDPYVYPVRAIWHARPDRRNGGQPKVTKVTLTPELRQILSAMEAFDAHAAQAAGHTVTSENAISTLQGIVDALPGIYRALSRLGYHYFNTHC